MGNLSIRCGAFENAGSRSCACPPALIGLDEFQLAIPRRVALQQGPPPLHQPGVACSTLGLPVEHFSSNGKPSLNWLSHPRGQVQSDAERAGSYVADTDFSGGNTASTARQ